jgi:predicted aconitase with swiveling domain
MHDDSLAHGTTVSFTLANSTIAAGNVLILNHVSGGTAGKYLLNAQFSNGSASIDVTNITSGAESEAIVIAFVVIKAVTA